MKGNCMDKGMKHTGNMDAKRNVGPTKNLNRKEAEMPKKKGKKSSGLADYIKRMSA